MSTLWAGARAMKLGAVVILAVAAMAVAGTAKAIPDSAQSVQTPAAHYVVSAPTSSAHAAHSAINIGLGKFIYVRLSPGDMQWIMNVGIGVGIGWIGKVACAAANVGFWACLGGMSAATGTIGSIINRVYRSNRWIELQFKWAPLGAFNGWKYY